MKLHESTVAVLKNFATINDSLIIKEGNEQETIHPEDFIYCQAVLKDSFPKAFAIYDLPQFLANYSSFNDPDLTFQDSYLTMKDKNLQLKYGYCNPAIVHTKSDEVNTIDLPDAEFTLTQSIFQQLTKLGNLNTFTHLTVIGKEGNLVLKVYDPTNDLSNAAEYIIENYNGKDFQAVFKMNNIRLAPADYDVKISLQGYATFENTDKTLRYFIALEEETK